MVLLYSETGTSDQNQGEPLPKAFWTLQGKLPISLHNIAYIM